MYLQWILQTNPSDIFITLHVMGPLFIWVSTPEFKVFLENSQLWWCKNYLIRICCYLVTKLVLTLLEHRQLWKDSWLATRCQGSLQCGTFISTSWPPVHPATNVSIIYSPCDFHHPGVYKSWSALMPAVLQKIAVWGGTMSRK